MIKRIFRTKLGLGLVSVLASVLSAALVNELQSVWSASSVQKVSKELSADADKVIRTAQTQATSDKAASDILADKGRKEATAKLNAATTDKKKLVLASRFFYGSYFINTRTRPHYCASLGVNIDSFVAAYKQASRELLEVAQKIQVNDFREQGYTYDIDQLYKIVLPSAEKYVVQDMKDTAADLKVSEREVCASFEQNPTEWASETDFRKHAPPEVAQLLLPQ
jgi:hypothetical protein